MPKRPSISFSLKVGKICQREILPSLTELPFIQKEIHAVFLMNTLNFAQDPHQILRESHRVLADDGWIFYCFI
ncbi:hypothetical protein CGSHiR3021_00162 [Haemophilus influenzae 22.4-21]|uniref:Methyltransferase type 11 domain-containing protein n=1 Tax=Haemophilus influenzae 22.4-21 TaxID=375063 RepID=A4P0L6_HAEIF|nr:hypothetical protein CGSHiR3021_00162 [Haemophilus influenzae 22.4-21]